MTLLIGRNNVGKTTAYAPLLLLRQTLGARDPRTALLFRGDLIDFGSYTDVVTDHDSSRQIEMYLDFGPSGARHRPRGEGANASSLDVTFAHSEEHGADLVRSAILDDRDRVVVSRTLQSSGTYKVVSPLLPRNSDVGRPYREVSRLRSLLQSEMPEGFLFSGFGGVLLPSDWREDEDRWEKVQRWYRASSDLFEVYYYVNDHIKRTLHNISYIGPLRSSPRRSYLLSAEPPVDVGRDGQWASEVLYQSSLIETSDVLARTNIWLTKLGFGELSFAGWGEYFQVFVQKSGSSVKINLADCGVGLSQLLPLLVQGCVMKAGHTLIAQQPEIHLNPAQQDVITDFLVEICASGRRVIIETHSEHILTRLRRRIAEAQTLSNDKVALYFTESDGDRSSLRRIDIGEWGEVNAEQWPRGFFGEQLENSLQMALAQSQRKKRSSV
ncbi:DUF3696 domain-containing protein [Mycobacterium ahvazicum]|uniref:DUF3696 domain-containing protein n=2 Tax=Mycobacterium ahvazicum TaxID=1964395 RepID=A0A2K4YA85_9MYCO|nr:DUF3696 domain-containing protein [Mycobacterium ahvazicum]